MSIHANLQRTTPRFWNRLVLAVEAMGESYEEQLEKRLSSLEGVVSRKARRSVNGIEYTVT